MYVRVKRKNETIEEVIKLSLYPLFIILLCIFGSIAFIFYSKDFPFMYNKHLFLAELHMQIYF